MIEINFRLSLLGADPMMICHHVAPPMRSQQFSAEGQDLAA